MPFRVMSFNVRMVNDRDGANNWADRASLNVRVIRDAAPDLIGFQELQQAHLEVYLEHLPGYEHVLGPGVSTPVNQEHPAVFWNPARFRLLASGGFYLSPTPEEWSRGWDSACPRGATWARFRVADEEVVFVNTHLDHDGEVARIQGSRLIVDRVERIGDGGAPTIITGDFNAGPLTPTQHVYLQAGFKDACEGLDEPSFHGFRGKARRRPRPTDDRIDWILIRNGARRLRVVDAGLVRDAEPPLYPSDHYPVVADLVLGA